MGIEPFLSFCLFLLHMKSGHAWGLKKRKLLVSFKMRKQKQCCQNRTSWLKTNKHSKNTRLITLVKVILVSRSKNCSQDRALQIRACRFELKFSPCKIYSATGVTNSWLGHRLMNEDPTFLLRFTCIFTLSRGAQIHKTPNANTFIHKSATFLV